jgi:hypothetical protein
MLLLPLLKLKLRFKDPQTLHDVAINFITHFKVLFQHAVKLKFQTSVRDLALQDPLVILWLATFSDPDQLLIGNLTTYLRAKLLNPVHKDIGAADRRIPFLEILDRLLRSGL